MLAKETIEKANSCEPFIEVDDTLNKLKNGNVIQDILDNDDEYLILKGISSKLTRNLLETFEKIILKLTLKVKKKQVDAFSCNKNWVLRSNL